MKLARNWKFWMARRAERNNVDYRAWDLFKAQYLNKCLKRYQCGSKFDHKDILFEEFIYGHSCHIAGLTAYNFQSQIFVKSMMEYAKPNLLILGGMSDDFLLHHENMFGMRHFYDHPIYKPDRMQCKERISKLLQVWLEKDHELFWDDRTKAFTYINPVDRRIEPQDYLTAAYIASYQPETKVALGKPSDAIVLEDLIMRYSAEELKGIAQRSIAKVFQRRGKQVEWHISYTREAIQNYVMSQQPEIYSKQLTYQAALLRRYAKISDKILMVMPGYFVQRVASQVHQIDVKPQLVYRNGLDDPHSQNYSLLQKTLRENDPQVILQKFALLALIRQSWAEKEFARGVNIFKNMCFGKLFQDMDYTQLRNRYQKAKQSTEGRWYDLIHHRINNSHVEKGPHIKNSLANQFKVLEERVTTSFPYTYQQKNYMSLHEDRVKMAKLEHKMREHLNNQGDQHQIEVFDHFLRGVRTKQGIILYSKLLGKMNVEMEERLKLPVFHYGAFRGIYKEYLRDFLLRGEEEEKTSGQLKQEQSKIQKIMEQHLKKLDDPIEIQKYLTGQKGKTLHVNFDPQEGPSFGPEEVEVLTKMFGSITPEREQLLREQYGEDWDKVQPQK